MTKRHDQIFDAVLSGVQEPKARLEKSDRAGARFLKRGNAISERLSGANEEKVLNWVDPGRCRMWERHNRDYALLNEENCRDLIEGIRAQGRQEFPAIVRRLPESSEHEFEVICGARRHFAVAWLQENNYPQFKYLIDVRDLSDEEAFRLGDIENREREDISDYERARDYAAALELYYAGKQKAMAARLEVSEVWLSRYLELSRLPEEVVAAYASIRDIRELHARILKPLLKFPKTRELVLAEARAVRVHQEMAGNGQGGFLDGAKVFSRLKASAEPPRTRKPSGTEYRGPSGASIVHSRQSKRHRLEFPQNMSREDFEAALAAFVRAEFGELPTGKNPKNYA